MKKLFLPLVLAVCVTVAGLYSINAEAGNITNVGMYQGDLYTYLSNVATMGNELKSDLNTVLGSYSTARAADASTRTANNTILVSYSSLRADYVDLRAKYNSLYANLSALNYQAGRTGGFATYTGTQKITMGDQRVAGSADSTVISGARVAASPDSTVISGARTTTTDLTLSGL